MKNTHRHLTLLVLLTVLACHRELPTPQAEEVAVVVSVLDVSQSDAAPVARRCDEAARDALTAWENATAGRIDVLWLATGGQAGREPTEPMVVVPWTELTDDLPAFATAAEHKAQHRALVQALVSKCRQAVQASDSSPIFAAVEGALESMAQHCDTQAKDVAKCAARSVHVHSDMLESVYGPLKARLEWYAQAGVPMKKKVAAKRAAQAPSAGTVRSVAGVQVSVCGRSDTRGDASTEKSATTMPRDTLAKAWAPVFGGQELPMDASCQALDDGQTPATTAETALVVRQ